MEDKTLVLAHYYTDPAIQQMADFVGDSLDLSLRAQESNAERIVFAGVKFMAETAKIINPHAEVIIPDIDATCSLVTMTDVAKINDAKMHMNIFFDPLKPQVVTYINSDVKLKSISDVIVTSANVEDVISDLINNNQPVLFTPDRNMGAYLAWSHPEWEGLFYYMKDAICEVHDKFKADEISKIMDKWYDYPPMLIAHPESPLPVLKRANFVGSTRKMLNWVIDFKHSNKCIIYVATEEGLLYNMREARPDLDIRLAPMYTGCQCNACPYMKKNTKAAVLKAIYGTAGTEIDYIPEDLRVKALKPIKRMLEWQK